MEGGGGGRGLSEDGEGVSLEDGGGRLLGGGGGGGGRSGRGGLLIGRGWGLEVVTGG